MESNLKGTNKVLLEYLSLQRLFFMLKAVAICALKI